MAFFYDDPPPFAPKTLVVRRVYRIGVQTLTHEDGRWYISIQNRTYRSRVELTEAQARRWYEALTRS
jgi:hypothetical protein